MYRFIFGFQRFVWCPKWTPASSSCFIEITALCPFAIPFFPPSVQGLFRRALRPSPFTPSIRGTPGRAPPVGDKLQLSLASISRSIPRVQLHILDAQVREVDVVAPLPQPEVDVDGVRLRPDLRGGPKRSGRIGAHPPAQQRFPGAVSYTH